jgi:hypothetical protein
MNTRNSWPIRFSKLIDINMYYEDQEKWESDLSLYIEKYLLDNNKEYKYDFQNNTLKIQFTKEEVSVIYERYSLDVISEMKYIVNIIRSRINDREESLKMIKDVRRVARILSKQKNTK